MVYTSIYVISASLGMFAIGGLQVLFFRENKILTQTYSNIRLYAYKILQKLVWQFCETIQVNNMLTEISNFKDEDDPLKLDVTIHEDNKNLLVNLGLESFMIKTSYRVATLKWDKVQI